MMKTRELAKTIPFLFLILLGVGLFAQAQSAQATLQAPGYGFQTSAAAQLVNGERYWTRSENTAEGASYWAFIIRSADDSYDGYGARLMIGAVCSQNAGVLAYPNIDYRLSAAIIGAGNWAENSVYGITTFMNATDYFYVGYQKSATVVAFHAAQVHFTGGSQCGGHAWDTTWIGSQSYFSTTGTIRDDGISMDIDNAGSLWITVSTTSGIELFRITNPAITGSITPGTHLTITNTIEGTALMAVDYPNGQPWVLWWPNAHNTNAILYQTGYNGISYTAPIEYAHITTGVHYFDSGDTIGTTHQALTVNNVMTNIYAGSIISLSQTGIAVAVVSPYGISVWQSVSSGGVSPYVSTSSGVFIVESQYGHRVDLDSFHVQQANTRPTDLITSISTFRGPNNAWGFFFTDSMSVSVMYHTSNFDIKHFNGPYGVAWGNPAEITYVFAAGTTVNSVAMNCNPAPTCATQNYWYGVPSLLIYSRNEQQLYPFAYVYPHTVTTDSYAQTQTELVTVTQSMPIESGPNFMQTVLFGSLLFIVIPMLFGVMLGLLGYTMGLLAGGLIGLVFNMVPFYIALLILVLAVVVILQFRDNMGPGGLIGRGR